MRMVVLAALLGLGIGLAGVSPAPAATIGGGLDKAAAGMSMVQDAYWACRRIRVCRYGPYGRYCSWRRVCRHW